MTTKRAKPKGHTTILRDQVVVDSEGNRSVVDVVLTQPRFSATLTMPDAILCAACGNPKSGPCAVCGN